MWNWPQFCRMYEIVCINACVSDRTRCDLPKMDLPETVTDVLVVLIKRTVFTLTKIRTSIADLITLPRPTGDVVPAEQCSGNPPALRKPCEMLCPDDCVLGDWSSWSSCSYCCSSKEVQGKQTRSRVILAPPGERRAFPPPSKTHYKHHSREKLILIVIYGTYRCTEYVKPSVKIALNYWYAWGLKLICTTSQSCNKIMDGKQKQWVDHFNVLCWNYYFFAISRKQHVSSMVSIFRF